MNERYRIPSIKPYGVAIQEAISSGDLEKMKVVAEQAEYMLENIDEIREAYRVLNDRIKDLEK